jgi:Zn-dependent protease with chaperone function
MRLLRWRPALSGAIVAASTVAAMAAASQRSGRPPEFLSTHPSEPTRIRQIEAWIPEAMQPYRPH